MHYKRVMLTRFGGPEELRVETVEGLPEPAPGEIRVRVLTAGTGFTDTIIRQGQYVDVKDKPPFVPGYDWFGVVDKLGSGVQQLAVGQYVADMPVIGSYTQYLCVKADQVVPAPAGLDPFDAVAMILSYTTAYQLLTRIRTLQPGSTCLVRAARLSMPEAMGAISAWVIPSLDTTILAKGHLLYNLACHPDQWSLLVERPDLIGSAIYETLRHSTPLRWFSRVAVRDYVVEGETEPRASRVMLLYGSANRDERRYSEPDRFDIMRDNRDQLAWGTGPHTCAGMHLARLEIEVLPGSMIEAAVTLVAGDNYKGV